MTSQDKVSAFLKTAGWNAARITPVHADFSSRRFSRLEKPDGTRAILMQADADQKTAQFVNIAGVLRELDISAPAIYAAAADSSLVLMEDLGTVTFGALLDTGRDGLPLYRRAVDVLVHLHKQFYARLTKKLSLPVFTSALFAEQATLFLDSYFPFAKKRKASPEERESFRAAWLQVLAPLDSLPQTLMLRDYMPDNLMDIPGRADWRSTGLLDFQDGGLGPVAYDLASLCESVRRNASASLLDDMTAYYHQQNPVMSVNDLRRVCRVLSAQRHTRVLGIIAKLAENPARRDKLAYVPRIWNYLHGLMQDDALRLVKTWFDQHFHQ
jgi:hypothetical protein